MPNSSLIFNLFGIFCIALFCIAYYFIAAEEKFHLNKSKPALFVGTGLFILIGVFEVLIGVEDSKLHDTFEHIIVEIAGIFFFLYVAMIYIEVLVDRGVFEALKSKMTSKGLTYKQLFWVIGLMTFFVSAIADNLTTALIFATIVLTIAKDLKNFVVPTAINIVVSANAGGAWSPFGDITTLMVWNAGKADFLDFFLLFPASFIGWATTAYLLSFYLPKGSPESTTQSHKHMKKGGAVVVGLGLLTIAIAIFCHQFLHIPAIVGMMFGLSMLMLYDFILMRRASENFGVFGFISKIENDTLLFFFGLLCAVGALSYLGYLTYLKMLYTIVDPTLVNIGIGVFSAIIDNVPLMYAVLKADPMLSHEQWLLVTLTAGIGGSLISFGSAAGVAIMGKMKSLYTFGSHMRLAWTVLLGYCVSILVWYIQFKIF